MIQIKRSELEKLAQNKFGDDSSESQNKILIMISTSLAARTSYTVIGEEKEINYEKLIELHDRLISQDPPHHSPLEHCARAMNDEEYSNFYKGSNRQSVMKNKGDGWCNNFKGFVQYKYLINNNINEL